MQSDFISGVVVPVSGALYLVRIPKQIDAQVKEIQGVIDGYFDHVSIPNIKAELYCDDDGLAKKLSTNVRASNLVGQSIVGPVLILGKNDKDGNATGLDEQILEDLKASMLPAGDGK